MQKDDDVYGEPEVIVYKNIIATVYRPILTDEEREKRMRRIKEAVISLLKPRDECWELCE